jgi:hypothetical protein
LNKITDLKNSPKGETKIKYFARENLKGFFCRDKAKLAYSAEGKYIFTREKIRFESF